MKSLGFKKNFSWALLGQFCNVAAQFLIITSIARIGAVADVGLYGIVSAIVSPLQLFFLMDLGKLVITEKNLESNISHFHFSFIINSIAVPIISCLVIFLIYRDVNMVLVTLSFSVYRSMANYREYYYSIYQRTQRLDFMGKSLILLSVITIIVFPLTYYFTKNIAVSFFFLSAAYFVTLVLNEIPNFKKASSLNSMNISVDFKQQKLILIRGVSLGATAFLTSFKSNVPRYIIEYTLKSRLLLGYYTLFAQCVNVIGTINQTAAKSSIGRLTQTYYNNKKEYFRLLLKASFASFAGGIILWVVIFMFGNIFIKLLFGAKYTSATFMLLWLVFARIFVLPSTYLKVTQVLLAQIHSQLIIMLLSILLILLIYFCFLSSLGIKGVLYSLVISEFFVLAATSFMVYAGNRRVSVAPD